MEFDIYGVFKDVFDENLTSKAESFNDIEGNGKDVESPFDYVDLFSHDAWNINSYTEACQNICNNCVKTNERFLKFTYADILACVKVEDTSKLAATTRQNKESRRVRFSTGVSITVDSNFHQASVSEMQFETDLEEPIICDEDLIRGVPYPHTGEAENKIESAFYEDIRTVGYGRTDKYNCLTYNNPFDPRITFQGLGPKSTQDNGQTNTAIKSRMGNAFLAIGNLDDVLDNYFNGYRNHLRNICMSSETFSSRTKGDHIVCHPDTDVKRKDLKIDDGGSLQCKKLFEMIRSGQVREIWSNRNDTAKKYTAAPITQKSRVKENQTKKTVKIDNRPAKIKVQSPSSDLTECNKHTKPDLNKKGKNEKRLHSSYQNRENGSAENLKQIPHGSAEMSSAPYDLSWSADCWDRSKNVTKSTHDNKLLRRAASECLAESLNGKIENDKSRTSHCADDGSLQIPIVLVPELNHQPSGDKEVTEFQHGDKIAKPRPDDVQNVKDLQNWADILFNDKLLQKDESTVDDNKEKDIDKGITKKRPKSETVEKSDKGSNKIPTLTHQEPVLEESVSTLVESNKTVRESVSTSDKTVRNIFKATTSDTTKKTSQQTALRSNRNTVAENKTHTGVQQNHPATNTGVHQIPTILTSGIQRGNHFSGYQQENYQYWASRSVLPTTFSSYHNYAGASPYPTQTVRQPPPGFTILGANRMQQTGRPNIQVNYPTPLLATTANKRMYAVPEASRQRYPQQLLNCFTSYSPYHPNCSYLSHNYNLRTGWSINMNNNNSNNDYNYNNNNNDHNNNNNSNINNNNVDFDNCNYLYGEEHHESADYSVVPLGFDSQPCNVDYPPQTYQSSMELCQDNVPIMNKSRPLRSNLIRIFPSTDC